jgi:Ketopantoate reductase PanE/ApbA
MCACALRILIGKLQTHSFGDYTFHPEKAFNSVQQASDFLQVTSSCGEDIHCWDYVVVTNSEANLIEPVVSKGTTIVLIQNGIGIEKPYADAFPENALLSYHNMGLIHWLLAAALTAHTATCTSTSIRSFENTNVQRMIRLGGSLTHVTTTFAGKALRGLGPNVYTLALSELDQKRTALFDVELKGSKEELKLEKFGFNAKRCAYPWYTWHQENVLSSARTKKVLLES